MSAEEAIPVFDPQGWVATLTHRPGVYRMLGGDSEVLYIGKAKDLKKRVASYFSGALNRRIQVMVAQVRRIEVTVTHTEAEALILENHLIKELRPRYNILLRDDKSYPYIFLAADHEFPSLRFYRGARSGPGRYFGPYPSAGATRETLQLMQKLFPVRQCEDSFYRNRSRPCLQYQIKRCTAPCVGFVSTEEYQRDVRHAVMFLEGKGNQIIEDLVGRMERAAIDLEFERAARYRDQIATLRRIQERQYVSGERGDLDIVTCALRANVACVQVFFIRAGRNLGNKAFFPSVPSESEVPEVLSAFLAQYYLGRTVPPEILVNQRPQDAVLLEQALADQAARRVRIKARVRGDRARWVRMAEQNASLALESRFASLAGRAQRIEALQEALALEELPNRIECFDISHTRGELTVGSCVVFDAQGAVKSDYRRFNVDGVTHGDDYAALEQVLTRRYTRARREEGRLPDLILIDGGKGQLAVADRVLAELGLSGIPVAGVAKGPDRKPGMEQLFLSVQGAPIILPGNSPALHLIQQIRDEAHRFAISGHRQRRSRRRKKSVLEEIPGVGPKRRRNLLKQFGGLQGIERAGVEDLCRAEGISMQLAQQIYQAFHGDI